MNTKVIFNTDKKLKAAAQRKAREQGLTLSAVLNLATKAYVDDEIRIDAIGRDIAEARGGRSFPAATVYRKLNLTK